MERPEKRDGCFEKKEVGGYAWRIAKPQVAHGNPWRTGNDGLII